jgi:hypothetical protein
LTAPKDKLSLEIDIAQWQWLEPHSQRDALFVVSRDLDLVEVGEKLAADDADTVQRWLASRLVQKPSSEQLASWGKESSRNFKMLIVSPFILIQESDAACLGQKGEADGHHA